jgi:hypothetical protein
MIIKSLLTEGADVRDIADRVQTNYRHRLVNMLINSKWFNSGLEMYGPVVKTFMMKFATEDFPWMIFMPKFWPSLAHLFLN